LGSKQLAEALRKEGFEVRVHDEYFRLDEADEVWLEACGRRYWIAITPDRRILTSPPFVARVSAWTTEKETETVVRMKGQ
jgi:hypothetical protein